MKLYVDKNLIWRALSLTLVFTFISVATAVSATILHESYGKHLVPDVQFAALLATFLPIVIAFPALYLFLCQAKQLAVTNTKLKNLVNFDALTCLLTRRAFFERAEKSLKKLDQTGRYCHGVLFLDIDRFKRINDTFGHATGDDVLVCLGKILKAHLEVGYVGGRIGGEEFAVFVPQISTSGMQKLAESINKSFRRKALIVHGIPVAATLSVGAFVSADNYDLDSLLKQADRLLYRAKEQGRDQVILADQPIAA